jgi:hypothetical protein
MEFGADVSIPQEMRPSLSAATRQSHTYGKPINLTTSNWRELAALHSFVPISERVNKLLRFVANRCQRPGTVTSIDLYKDYPMADCADWSELSQYLDYLTERKLLREYYDDDPSHTIPGYAPTIEGWQVIEPTLSPGGNSRALLCRDVVRRGAG